LGSDLVLGARVAPLDSSIFADANQDAALNAQADNDSLLAKAAGGNAENAAACAAAGRVMPDETDARGASQAAQMTSAISSAFCGAGGWIEATGSTASIDNSRDAAGYSGNDAGFFAGLDRPVNDSGTRLGLALGYDDAWVDDKTGGKASTETVRVGLYAAQPAGAFTPSVSLGCQLETVDRGKSVTAITQDNTLFASGRTSLDASAAHLGASLTAGKNNWTLDAKYAATLAGNYTAQTGEAGLEISF